MIADHKVLEVEEPIPQIDFNIGVAYLQLNQIDLARESFQKAIDINQEFTQAWYNLGATYEKELDFDGALDIYSQGLKAKPDSTLLAGGKINILRRMGENDKALSEAKKALEDNGNNLGALNAIGRIYMDEKRYDEALFIFLTARTKPGGNILRFWQIKVELCSYNKTRMPKMFYFKPLKSILIWYQLDSL